MVHYMLSTAAVFTRRLTVHQEVSLPDLTCVNLKMRATFLLYTLTHTIKPGHHASTIYGTNNTMPEIVTNSDSHRE